MKMTMTIRRANRRDLEAANRIVAFLLSIQEGFMPDELGAGEEHEWFDLDDPALCQRALQALVKISRQASIHRVTLGMTVLLDPRNELIDPAAERLALHPKLAGLLNNLAPTPEHVPTK